MKLSRFGEKFTAGSGIVELMDDLSNAILENPDIITMGGGNPARIPVVEDLFRKQLKGILANDSESFALLGRYQAPQGEANVLTQVARLLRNEYGWAVTEKNIAISNGGQSAFFILANLFAGLQADGSHKQIQFPLAPEYLGYADSGLTDDFFVSSKPRIEILADHLFKYRVDFEALQINDNTGALCVSRPTNPTGNVLTDDEIETLESLASQHRIPLIIDGAYGLPFPNIIFSDVNPYWSENIVLMLSLSKLGLPGVRSGFVVASEEIISAFSRVNTIMNLASGNLGPALAGKLFQDKLILRISKEHIQPYYQQKSAQACQWFNEALGDVPFYIHKPEGAIFLWLWFKDLPISSYELYQRLKAAGVLVVPGETSFPGIKDDWQHTRECIRVSYAQSDDKVRAGIQIIANTVREIYSN